MKAPTQPALRPDGVRGGGIDRGWLPNELRLFPSPWHRYVHGLGLGQQPTGYDANRARWLLETSHVLAHKTGSTGYAVFHRLLQGIISTCAAMSLGEGGGPDQRLAPSLADAVAQLSDPWRQARTSAAVTESLVKLGQPEAWRSTLHRPLALALERVVALDPPTDKGRYEKLQLLTNLLLAAGQAGCMDLLAVPQQGDATPVDVALQTAETVSDVFYRGRGAAILFTALGVIGHGRQVCDGPRDYLGRLLEKFDVEFKRLPQRVSDGVHAGLDYYLFPLSLTLTAIAVLRRPEYLEYRRNWIEQAVSYFHRLAAPSQASQALFLVSALNNLGVLKEHVPDVGMLLHDCVEGFLQATNGTGPDDYLRCTYLVHLAQQLGRTDMLTPRVWAMLTHGVLRVGSSDVRPANAYGSGYMVAAYVLSAFDVGGRFEALFGEEISLPRAIGRCMDDARTTAANLPKIGFVLTDVALRLRPANPADTPLFRPVRL